METCDGGPWRGISLDVVRGLGVGFKNRLPLTNDVHELIIPEFRCSVSESSQ